MPFLGDLLFELGAERVDRRKTIAPGVGAAGIENRPAVDEIAGVALVGCIAGSSGVLQQPSMMLMAVLGSQRVDTAQITSFISDGSMSSSTTMTKRP